LFGRLNDLRSVVHDLNNSATHDPFDML
jgi:hypothetical protein